MKPILFALLSFLSVHVFAQGYPFAKDFINGSIILKDSSQQTGQIKWFPVQTEKLRFRKTGNDDINKYSPQDLLGFTVDTLRFASLFNFKVYAEDYALLGKQSKISHAFGEVVDSGSYNIYLVIIGGYNAISGGFQAYPNYLFERKIDNVYQYAAYPFEVRMKDKKYEKAKEDLYLFFKDYPSIIDKIKSFKKGDNFLEIINLMKSSN